MNKEESVSLNVYQRIHAAMGEVSYVQKHKPKGMQYSITSHDDVTALVRPALHKHGVIYLPTVIAHGQDANRTWAEVRTLFQNIDDPEDSTSNEMFGYGVDAQDKGPGKAISSAVKYCLLKAMGLETGDDPDKQSLDYKPIKTAKEIKDDIWSAVKENDLDLGNVRGTCSKMYGVTLEDASVAVLEGLLESITNSPDMYRHYEANEE